MAKNFSTSVLRLGNQIVTATGNLLYVNGAPDGTGAYDPIGAAASVSGFAQRKSQMVVTFSAAPLTWASMPLAQTFFNASFGYTTYLDLTQFTGVNLVVNRTATAGTTSGALYLGYLGNPSSTAASYLNLDANATRVRLAPTNTVATSGFNPIVAAARSGVYVALLGASGNAALGPTFGMVTAIFQ